MPRLTLMHSFLDRFEKRLQVDCEQLKRQLLAQVDHRFGALRAKVAELRNRFAGTRPGTVNIDSWIDDPPVETVSLDQFIQEQHADLVNQPSTCTSRKRKLPSGQSGGVRKRTAQANAFNRKYFCKFPGCDRSFVEENKLARHERIHLGIKPYFCTWPECKYASEQRGLIVRHIRFVHFKLPQSVKKQIELNIIDDRDPNQFVRVDQQLANRRL